MQPEVKSFTFNPFQENTTLTFSIPQAGDVVLKIFNIASQEVEILFHGSLPAGTYTHTWQSEDYPAGFYYCSLISDGQQYMSRKLVHIK